MWETMLCKALTRQRTALKITLVVTETVSNNRSSRVYGARRHRGSGKFLQFRFELFHLECKSGEVKRD